MEINKIYCGDCLKLMKDIPDNTIDLIVTSPPYDNLRDYNGYSFNFETIAKELFRVTKDGGVVVWVVGDATVDGSESGTSFKHALFFKEIGFLLYDTMFYRKNTSGYPSLYRYEQVIEYMFILSKGKPITIHLLKDKPNRWAGKSNFGIRSNRQKDGSLKKGGKSIVANYGIRHNIWEYATGYGYSAEEECAYKHPAIFPEKLAEDHILSWSNKGDLVLDPMCGSGTTLKMAIRNGRNFIGIDCSEEYCKIANERIQKELSQAKLTDFGLGK